MREMAHRVIAELEAVSPDSIPLLYGNLHISSHRNRIMTVNRMTRAKSSDFGSGHHMCSHSKILYLLIMKIKLLIES